MGGWHLEVFKMGMCMMFPISMFYFFNHPKLITKKLEDDIRVQFERENAQEAISMRELVNDYKEAVREKQHKEWSATHERLLRIQASHGTAATETDK